MRKIDVNRVELNYYSIVRFDPRVEINETK